MMESQWFIIVLTLLFSAFFSGAEIAFVSSNKLLLELDKQKNIRSGRILSSFVKSPSSFISALLLGNNIALVVYGIAAATIIEPFIDKLFPSLSGFSGFQLLAQTLLATLLILITAEFLPKLIFRIYSNRILSFLAVPLKIIYIIFYPLNMFFFGVSRWLLVHLFKLDFDQENYPLTPVDFDMVVREYADDKGEEEELEPEMQMLHNAIEFKTVRLRECMIPRTEIVALEERASISKLERTYADSGHSKIIIYKDTIDNIIGYTHAYDLFSRPNTIESILKPILFVPGTMLASQLLSRLIKEQKSIAVVVDEFGGTSGMLTLEDVIEEIFGEINDEFDMDELIEKQTGEQQYIFSGRLEIDALNEKYHFDLPKSEEYETLAGYILKHYENIPETGSEIQIGPYKFSILKASETRIDQVRMEREDEAGR
ncbi:MAG: hemolysin family protein [Bacteroidota bacterium]